MVINSAGIGALAAITALVILGHHYQNLIKPRKLESTTRRSCLCSDKKNKTKKKVHFASDVVEPRDSNQEYRRRWIPAKICPEKVESNIPANRVAVYRGIMRYRAQQASVYY